MKPTDWVWVFSGISIIACFLNVKKKKVCFLIWCLSNMGFVWVNIATGLYGQIPLWIAFTLLNVYGYVQWARDEES
jgi:nicotinamide riboside transporter PnuC